MPLTSGRGMTQPKQDQYSQKQIPNPHPTPHTASTPQPSATQEHPAPPLAHHYTPGPADAAKWAPP